MRKSVERVTRVAAVTTALLAGIGGQALAAGTAERPTIGGMGRIIDAQKTVPADSGKPGNPDDAVRFKKSLPHGERASAIVASTTTIDGKPAPDSVDYLSISIRPPQPNLDQFVAPVEKLTFTKTVNGKWDAYEELGNPVNSTSMYNLEEIGDEYTNSFVTTVTGNNVTTTNTPNTPAQINAKEATGVLHSLERDAAFDLGHILHGYYFTEGGGF